MSITRDALNLTVEGLALLPSRHEISGSYSPPRYGTLSPPPPPVLISVGQDWRPVQTYSLEDPLP